VELIRPLWLEASRGQMDLQTPWAALRSGTARSRRIRKRVLARALSGQVCCGLARLVQRAYVEAIEQHDLTLALAGRHAKPCWPRSRPCACLMKRRCRKVESSPAGCGSWRALGLFLPVTCSRKVGSYCDLCTTPGTVCFGSRNRNHRDGWRGVVIEVARWPNARGRTWLMPFVIVA